MFPFEILSNPSLILDKIFTYMNVSDLYRTRRVCKLWMLIAENEIKKRRKAVQVDYVAVTFRTKEPEECEDPVEAVKARITRSVNLLKEKFDKWRQSWEFSPTILLVSHRLSFGNGISNSWVPHDCTCVMVSGNPVSVDGENTDGEIFDMSEVEFCNYLALRSLNVSVLASSVEGVEHFLRNLYEILDDPDLKLILIFVHQERIDFFSEVANAPVNAASRRGVVVLCCSPSLSCIELLNFRGRELTYSGFAVIYFKGQNVSAASILPKFSDLDHLKKCWKILDSAQKGFFSGISVKPQILAFMLCPPVKIRYKQIPDENGDMQEIKLYNEDQETFRSVFSNIPLIGWSGACFLSGTNTNLADTVNNAGVLCPKRRQNYVYAVLAMW